MTPCEHYSELISCLIDGELTNEERESVLEHIAVCEECCALYNAFAAVSAATGEDLEEVPEAVHENIMADLRREALRKNNNRRKRHLRAAISAVACLALVITAAFAAAPLLSPKGESNMMVRDYEYSSTTGGAAEESNESGAKPESFMTTDTTADLAVPEVAEEESEETTSGTAPEAAVIDEAAAPEAELNSDEERSNSKSALQVYELMPDADIEKLLSYLSGGSAVLPEGEPDSVFAVVWQQDGEQCFADVCIFGEESYFSFNAQDFNLSPVSAHELVIFLQNGGK